MWVKCVLVWYSQPLTSIFGVVNSSIKKMRVECRLHPSHSMLIPHFSITVEHMRGAAALTAFSSLLENFEKVFSAFLGAKFFFWKSAKKVVLYHIQYNTIENIFITFFEALPYDFDVENVNKFFKNGVWAYTQVYKKNGVWVYAQQY